MRLPRIASVVLLATLLGATIRLVAQDRFVVTSPNGIAFSEFKGYDSWASIAPSQTDADLGCMKAPCLKAILGNAVMMKAYADGIPGSGKAVPDGAMIAKVEWSQRADSASPYGVTVPASLNDISFMVKDAKRFPDTNGWGYAQFRYNGTTRAFTAYGRGASFAKADCHQCHVTGAKARDFVFTHYAAR